MRTAISPRLAISSLVIEVGEVGEFAAESTSILLPGLGLVF
jgi:hypothetical protein